MPIEIGIWRLGGTPERIPLTSMDSESRLEKMISADISVISPDLMHIGTQVPTAHGKFIDMLAMDAEGNLTVVELKRNRTPREVIAQLLDYASWVQNLSYTDIGEIYAQKNPGKEFEVGFDDAFGASPPEKLNESHELIVVASELDPATERIIDYLGDNFGVPVNAVFFRYFRDGEHEYLTRTWLVDPQLAETKGSKAATKKGSEVWNGRDFYVAVGEGPHRTWEDCRKYGYVSGGGGKWYSQTLNLLFPGARVFAMLPKIGYVGVGIVTGNAIPVTEFKVSVNGEQVPILKAPLKTERLAEHASDPDKWEYFVPVEWEQAVPSSKAYWEKGLFAKQHTACRLKNQFTIERLVKHFDLDE